jgi:hypothetical protein
MPFQFPDLAAEALADGVWCGKSVIMDKYRKLTF